jgi:hypothetical protein
VTNQKLYKLVFLEKIMENKGIDKGEETPQFNSKTLENLEKTVIDFYDQFKIQTDFYPLSLLLNKEVK